MIFLLLKKKETKVKRFFKKIKRKKKSRLDDGEFKIIIYLFNKHRPIPVWEGRPIFLQYIQQDYNGLQCAFIVMSCSVE